MKKTKSLVLQVGESTHTHVLNSQEDISYREIGEGGLQFLLKGTGVLMHEEHHTMVFKKGTYFKFPQVEYDPMNRSIRAVYD